MITPHPRRAFPHAILGLPLICLSLLAFGQGCISRHNPDRGDAPDTSVTMVLSPAQVPAVAVTTGVTTLRLPVQGSGMRVAIDSTLAASADFSRLKDYLIERGYPFVTSTKDYIAARDQEGPLVGFSHRFPATDGKPSALFVALFRLQGATFASPMYLYVEIDDFSAKKATRIWATSSGLQGYATDF